MAGITNTKQTALANSRTIFLKKLSELVVVDITVNNITGAEAVLGVPSDASYDSGQITLYQGMRVTDAVDKLNEELKIIKDLIANNPANNGITVFSYAGNEPDFFEMNLNLPNIDDIGLFKGSDASYLVSRVYQNINIDDFKVVGLN